MKFCILIFMILVGIVNKALAKPEPGPVKSSRFRTAQIVEDALDKRDNENFENSENNDIPFNDFSKMTDDRSSGRFFVRKLLLIKKMFSHNHKQRIVPVIITRAGDITSDTFASYISPVTTTITTTVTAPTDNEIPTWPPARKRKNSIRFQSYGSGTSDKTTKNVNYKKMEDDTTINEQPLVVALDAGIKGYIDTDQEIEDKLDAQINRVAARINLKRHNGKRIKILNICIPSKYKKYFRNRQNIILNTNKRKRPVKLHIVRHDPNRKHIKKNKKKSHRSVTA